MKRLLLVALVGCVNVSYALFGLGNTTDQVINEAQQLIKNIESFNTRVNKQGATPTSLKKDLQTIESYRLKIKDITGKVRALLARTYPDYVEDLEKSYKENLAGISNFGVEEVYPYLQAKLMPTGKQGSIQKLSASELKEKIMAYRKKFPNDRKMRQTEFFFANELTKEEFDAYLKGPKELNKLRITDAKQKTRLEKIFPDEIARATALLDESEEHIKDVLDIKK